MSRYNITNALLLIALLAVALGWWWNCRELRRQLDYHDSKALLDALDMAVTLKFGQNKPTTYLDEPTQDLEESLELDCHGETIQSTGWSIETLRKPEPEMTDLVVVKLNSDSKSIRINALKLLALYAEAFNTEQKYAFQELGPAEQHFCNVVVPVLRPPLTNHDTEIRKFAALAIGFTCRQRETIDTLTYAFKNETDGTAKMYIAWAIAWQF